MTEGIDIQALAREIAARMDPIALMDADDVAAVLKCCTRQVLERHAKHPDFPPSVNMSPEPGKKSRPTWIRRDIAAYIERRRKGEAKQGGRPRRIDA